MTNNETLIPMERLLEIVQQVAKRHCKPSRPDFEDIVQDILLGILERQDEFDSDRGTPERFVLTVANQKACNRNAEQRRHVKTVSTNRNGCIPFQTSPEDANELDANGDLPCNDESILFAQFFSFLDSEHVAVLKLRLEGYTVNETRRLLGISVSEYQRTKKILSEKYEIFQLFQKNNAMREN